jgi:hypothetical protein
VVVVRAEIDLTISLNRGGSSDWQVRLTRSGTTAQQAYGKPVWLEPVGETTSQTCVGHLTLTVECWVFNLA